MEPHKQILCIDLSETQYGALAPLAAGRFLVQRMSYTDAAAQLQETAGRASLVLLRWDGSGYKASTLLSQWPKELRAGRRIFAVVSNETNIVPTPREAKQLDLGGCLMLPSRYYELERVLHDVAPAAPDDPAEGLDDVRRLRGAAPTGGLTAATIAALQAWAAQREGGLPVPRGTLVIAHGDEAHGVELKRLVEACGARGTRLTATADQGVGEVRRGAAGLVLWHDGKGAMARLVLEHLAEAGRYRWTPVLLLIPGENALRTIVEQENHLFFDALAVFDRRSAALKAALLKLKESVGAEGSTSRLLMQLRAPFLAGATRRDLDLEAARAQAAALAAKPGKAFWAHLELVPCLLTARRHAEARAELAAAEALRPNEFALLRVRAAIAVAADDRRAACHAFVEAVLARRDLTRDRLYRAGDLLERWGAADALADLLDAWTDGPLGGDPQHRFLAARYYRLVKRPETASRFLAAAVVAAPLRPEYLDLLATMLGERRLHEREHEVLRVLLDVAGDSVPVRLRIVKALVAGRHLREARQELAALASVAPTHPEVVALKKTLAS